MKIMKVYCNQIRWSYIVDDIIDSNKIKVENSEIRGDGKKSNSASTYGIWNAKYE